MRVYVFFFLCSVLCGCSNQDQNAKAGATAADVEATYAVTATEDGLVTVLMQFGAANELAQSRLAPDETVLVDGEPVAADSSSVGGVFYELQKPLADFLGTHTISIAKKGRTLFTDSFSIAPFFLPDTLSPPSLSQPMVLQLENFTDTAVRVLLVDGDFASADINETYPVTDGKLEIPVTHLQQSLVPGPAVLELYLEKETEKRNRRLLNTYNVKRGIELIK